MDLHNLTEANEKIESLRAEIITLRKLYQAPCSAAHRQETYRRMNYLRTELHALVMMATEDSEQATPLDEAQCKHGKRFTETCIPCSDENWGEPIAKLPLDYGSEKTDDDVEDED